MGGGVEWLLGAYSLEELRGTGVVLWVVGIGWILLEFSGAAMKGDRGAAWWVLLSWSWPVGFALAVVIGTVLVPFVLVYGILWYFGRISRIAFGRRKEESWV